MPLPPWADLTPIEEMFSKVKEALRSAGPRIKAAVYAALVMALSEVNPEDIAGWFGDRAAYAMQPLSGSSEQRILNIPQVEFQGVQLAARGRTPVLPHSPSRMATTLKSVSKRVRHFRRLVGPTPGWVGMTRPRTVIARRQPFSKPSPPSSPAVAAYRNELSTTYLAAGQNLAHASEAAEGQDAVRKALELLEGLATADPRNPAYPDGRAEAWPPRPCYWTTSIRATPRRPNSLEPRPAPGSEQAQRRYPDARSIPVPGVVRPASSGRRAREVEGFDEGR